MNNKLINLGFDEIIIEQSSLYKGLYLGRIIAQYNDLYKVATINFEVTAEVSGKFRHLTNLSSDYPVVGDFVMIDRESSQMGNAIIHNILSRKTVFGRKSPGKTNDVQIIASNIDIIFICMSVNKDFNLRRLERYLSITWDSSAIPVIVITKSDLCEDISSKLTDINAIAIGVDIIVTTSITKDGYKPIKKYITSGKTVAFIGSSGVGKSTLINRLIGKDILETRDIRSDDKGRHTTTRRELILIPSGGAVIDTPGMRELGIESANLSKTFSDIEELAIQCKFRDCTHTNEPQCAVKKAIKNGLISEKRFLNYKKLEKELGYENLNSKQREKKKLNEMFSDVGGMKKARKFIKTNNKNK